MNLYAYQKIEQLQPIADENGIKIPRLRGYLLMKKEEKYSKIKIKKIIRQVKKCKKYAYENKISCKNDKRKMRQDIKRLEMRVKKSISIFNKYVGQDVLYIHARIGGENWENYGCQWIEKMDWFLKKVDDYFDETYCDIYAKINVTNNYLKLLEGS